MKDGRLSKRELMTLMTQTMSDPEIKARDFIALAGLYIELLGPRKPRKKRASREYDDFEAVRKLEAQRSSRLPS